MTSNTQLFVGFSNNWIIILILQKYVKLKIMNFEIKNAFYTTSAFLRRSIVQIPWEGKMDFQQLWLIGLYKGGDTWTGELLISLIGES